MTLQPVSTEGTPLGQPTQVSIRSSRVGLILWIVMAVGGTALFVAIVLRIWRRVRRRRRTHGPVLKQAAVSGAEDPASADRAQDEDRQRRSSPRAR